MVNEGLIDCIVQLPSHLFANTQITACIWFYSRKTVKAKKREILFIDGSNLGRIVKRNSRILTEKDVKKISDKYHSWKNKDTMKDYADCTGFCKSVNIEIIESNNYNLSPNRY